MTRGRSISIAGVSEGLIKATEYVMLPIVMQAQDGEKIRIYGEVHLVEQLPVPLLIGNNILQSNCMDIIWKSPDDKPALRIQGHFVPVFTNGESSTHPKTTIFRIEARESLVVPAGHGMNVPVVFPRLHNTRKLQAVEKTFFTRPKPIYEDLSIGMYGRVISALVDGTEERLPFANLGKTDIRINRGTTIGFLDQNTYFDPSTTQAFYTLGDVFGERTEMDQEDTTEENPPTGAPYLLEPTDDDASLEEANVSDHWGPEYERKARDILKTHRLLFRKELGRFNDGITMPIPFKRDPDLTKLKQAPYHCSLRDKNALDSILDPLKRQKRIEKVPLGDPSAASSPAFVVWKGDKPRIVVDLRRVNSLSYPDAYPLPKQDDILQALGGAVIFSSIDMTKGFFQQDIAEEDRWKTAFVTPHRGHERFTVSTMGLMNSPGFFQHRMEDLFKDYLWKFLLVYIDDVIIYSRSLEEHLNHLDQALHILANIGVTIGISKCHFAYPSVQALGHRVSRLGLSTLREKTDAIRKIAFPKTLKQLEMIIGLFNYYRKYVPRYAHRVENLQALKTLGFKNAPNKGYERDKHASQTLLKDQLGEQQLKACEREFEAIKELLCTAPILAFPDFARPFVLHVDGSKERGFGAALYQRDEEGHERPILYISKRLIEAEKKYHPTELETGALVWALTKLPQYTDGNTITVHVDHQAIKQSFADQGPVKGKRSERLASWRLFLSRYWDRMTIIHVPGKTHRDADALSRLPTTDEEESELTMDTTKATIDTGFVTPSLTLYLRDRYRKDMREDPVYGRIWRGLEMKPVGTIKEGFYTNGLFLHQASGNKIQRCFPIDATWKADYLEMSPQLRKDIVEHLPDDQALGKLYSLMVETMKRTKDEEGGPKLIRESFTLDPSTMLLYQGPPGEHRRLCIPKKLYKQVFQAAHDKKAHQGTNRVVDRLRQNIYIPRLKQRVHEYVSGCPECQMSKPSRKRPVGRLKPIESPTAPFQVLCLDFVVGLPMTNHGMDAILTVTDKFTKAITLIPGKNTWDATDWAIAFYDYVYCRYGLPLILISDRDPKFTSKFWKALFKKAGVSLAMTAAYHPQANGQSERSNQTVEAAIRCITAEGKARSEWDELLPEIEYALNTSPNQSTGTTPFQLMYGIPPRDEIAPQTTDVPEAEHFFNERKQIREDALDRIKLAQARMAQYYDARHSEIKPSDKVWLKLAKGTAKGYRLPHTTAIDPIRVGPFAVKEKINDVAYKLHLPTHIKIHPVISIIHLEPANEDIYNRQRALPGPILVEDEQKYIIDRIVDRQQRQIPGSRRKGLYYRVRWKGYQPKDDTWESEQDLQLQVPELIESFKPKRGLWGWATSN